LHIFTLHAIGDIRSIADIPNCIADHISKITADV